MRCRCRDCDWAGCVHAQASPSAAQSLAHRTHRTAGCPVRDLLPPDPVQCHRLRRRRRQRHSCSPSCTASGRFHRDTAPHCRHLHDHTPTRNDVINYINSSKSNFCHFRQTRCCLVRNDCQRTRYRCSGH